MSPTRSPDRAATAIGRTHAVARASRARARRWGWIAVVIIAVPAAAFAWRSWCAVSAAAVADRERRAWEDEMHARIAALGKRLDTDAGCTEAMELARVTRCKRDQESLGAALQSLAKRAAAAIEARTTARARLSDEEERWKRIRQVIGDPESGTIDELWMASRKMDEMSHLFLNDSATRGTVTAALARRLREAAEMTTGAVTLSILAQYTRAEDLMAAAQSRFAGTSHQRRWAEDLARVVAEADQLATRLFTAEWIDQRAWRDLLYPLPGSLVGFARAEHGHGIVSLANPDKGFGREVSLRQLTAWRDVVIDLQVTLAAGTFTLALRSGSRTDAQTLVLEFTAADDRADFGALAPGKPSDIEVILIGSTLRAVTRGEGEPPRTSTRSIPGDMRRFGGIAIVAPVASRLAIARLRIKDLRD